MAFTRDDLIRKAANLRQHGASAERIGNMAEAEAFAARASQLVLEHCISEAELSKALQTVEPIVERKVDFEGFGLKVLKRRVAWLERLAEKVAFGHLCKTLVQAYRSNQWFVGTETNTKLAEFAYVTLVRAAKDLMRADLKAYRRECWRSADDVLSFKASWQQSFVNRIGERYREARKAALAKTAIVVTDVDARPITHTTAADLDDDMTVEPQPTSTEAQALVALNQAVVRVETFIDEHYGAAARKAKGQRALRGLGYNQRHNVNGARAGRAAADVTQLDRKVLA